MRKVFLGALSCASFIAVAAVGVSAEAATPRAAPEGKSARALAAFDTVQRVLQHPRCQNCHVPGDAPLQSDDGTVHGQDVKRGADGRGVPELPCGSCHGESNLPESYGAHTPPGAPGWHLPPPSQKMVFVGLSKADLCATIKDPKRNGGRSLQAIFDHLDHDPLVMWGWNPGDGRVPVAVSHDVFIAAVKEWMEGGAPCP